jgi:hypothetical protein
MRRMKHVFMFLLALGMLAYAAPQSAQAALIMMTGDGWNFYNSNTNAYKDFTVGGVSLRVNIESYATGTAHSLSYDTSAGFGVISASGSSPLLDSVTGNEILIVTFNRIVTVSGYGMSNWSTGSGLYTRFYKFGSEISLPTTGGSFDTNGFMSFSFAGTSLSINESVRFNSNGGTPNDDLRLAKLDVTVNGAPVPIPGALWLLGSGLIGLVTLRRRMKK